MKTLTFGIQHISRFFFNKLETSWHPIAVFTHYHATAHIFLHFFTFQKTSKKLSLIKAANRGNNISFIHAE